MQSIRNATPKPEPDPNASSTSNAVLGGERTNEMILEKLILVDKTARIFGQQKN